MYKRQSFDDALIDVLDDGAKITRLRSYSKRLAAQMRLQAVSYTHLRAHETVLDLVCRLLLEKKKNKKKHNVSLLT